MHHVQPLLQNTFTKNDGKPVKTNINNVMFLFYDIHRFKMKKMRQNNFKCNQKKYGTQTTRLGKQTTW